MSMCVGSRTWVCLHCEKSYRRRVGVGPVVCGLCGKECERVHCKLHIPSPRRKRAWRLFWSQYLKEKRMIAQFDADPRAREVKLSLLNVHYIKEPSDNPQRRPTVWSLPTRRKSPHRLR